MAESINLAWPLQKSNRGAFLTNESTLDAISDDIRLLLITNHGERPIHFDYGANLRQVIFELQGADLRQVAADLINDAVDKWLPFVNLVRVDVFDSTTDSTLRKQEISIEIEFSVGNLDVTRFLKQRIRA